MTRKIIVVPWIVTAWLYELPVMTVSFGGRELRADQQREEAAEREEDRAPSRCRGSRSACGRPSSATRSGGPAPVGAVRGDRGRIGASAMLPFYELFV